MESTGSTHSSASAAAAAAAAAAALGCCRAGRRRRCRSCGWLAGCEEGLNEQQVNTQARCGVAELACAQHPRLGWSRRQGQRRCGAAAAAECKVGHHAVSLAFALTCGAASSSPAAPAFWAACKLLLRAICAKWQSRELTSGQQYAQARRCDRG